MRLSEPEIQLRLEALAERCRTHGVPLTPQRTAIYRTLLASDAHPDAELLFDQVRQAFPNLSLATVYKNLEALEKLGVIHELTPLHETARFDANLDDHHHLVCVNCKQVTDLYSDGLDALRVPAPQLKGFKVSRIRVQVEGLCPACSK
jgi:Fur family peroxide stress response transcriptional regulator